MGENHQEEQQPPELRSINNVERSFVKFINKTLHNVILYWIDYQGQAVSYGVLSPDDSLDINTFVTHPWIFVDQESRDSCEVVADDRILFGANIVCEHALNEERVEVWDQAGSLPGGIVFDSLEVTEEARVKNDIAESRMDVERVYFRYTVNQQNVFFPEPWFAKYRRLRNQNPPRELPQRPERTNVYITLPVYTLRELSLRAIKRRLTHDRQAFQLDIPRSLQYELATMLSRNEDNIRVRNS
ncbi:hypothetical protein WH47_05698 [Habropoda laboriosa]|uniref:von Hippel-Lindau disease tumour suppressor beta domain-containing protein n=1 Tax=Habropoda laboriosa TaxID=597456 RepID=A0A0L7QQL7_9HYME|nr:hypothetical protein WH47_05698 [Habropoda laboriosa]